MLEVNIQKSLGRLNLDVCFTHEGGVSILFGPSGAGKTTVLRMIAGIVKPDSGSIRFDGRTLFCSEKRINVAIQRRPIGFIFQHHNLFPHMSVLQNIAYAAAGEAEVDRWIESFHLGHVADRFPGSLSGGERQRVAIARSLATKPDLLLMDEPMSSLDVGTRHLLLQELRDLQRETRVPIVYVTHDVSESFRLGDRVLAIEGGRIVQDGPPIDVFHTPASIAIATLSGTENILDGVIEAHHPTDNTTDLRIENITMHVLLCRGAVGERAVVAIRPEDILVALRELPETSARNQLAGRVVSVEHDVLSSLLVAVDDGPTLRARVTRRSIDSLGLKEGVAVCLLIKAWACHEIAAEARA